MEGTGGDWYVQGAYILELGKRLECMGGGNLCSKCSSHLGDSP